MSQNLRKDYIWNTVGVFLQNAVSPVLLLFVTRINGVFDAGIFSFVFSLAIVFWAISMWGGRTYQVSDANNEFRQVSYIKARLVTSAVVIVIALLFAIVNQYDVTKTSILMSLVVFKAIESIADAVQGVIQKHDQLALVGKLLSAKYILGVVIFIVIDIITKDIVASTVVMAVTVGLFTYYFDFMVFGRKKLQQHEKYNKNISTRREVGLIIRRTSLTFYVQILAMFSLMIPRYFIDKYHPMDNGYFGIMVMPITLIVLMVSMLIQPSVVMISKHFSKQDFDTIWKIAQKMIGISIAAGVFVWLVTMLIGNQLLTLLFGVDFTSYNDALLVLVGGAVANAVVAVLVILLTIVRQLKAQVLILFVTSLIELGVSVVVIKGGGVMAASTLFAVTCLAQAALLYVAFYASIKRNGGHEKN